MSLIPIPNQFIKFVDDGAEDFNTWNQRCTKDDTTFCQMVDTSTVTKFQVDLTEVDGGSDLITDGDFIAACGTNWTCASGMTINTGTNELEISGVGSITQNIDVVNGGYYRLRFTSEGMEGFLTPNNLTVNISTGSSTIFATGMADGSWDLYIHFDGTTGTQTLTISNTTVSQAWTVSEVTMYQMTSLGGYITDCDGNLILPAPSSIIELREGAYQTTDSGKAMVTIDWGFLVGAGALPYGCYKICGVDLTEIVANMVPCGDFDGMCIISMEDLSTIHIWCEFCDICWGGSGTGNIGATLDSPVLSNRCYNLEFTLSGTSEDSPGTWDFIVTIDGQTIYQIDSATFTSLGNADGTWTAQFTGISGDAFNIHASNDSNFTLSDVSVKIAPECNIKMCSECISLKADHGCDGEVIKIVSTNDNDFLLSNNQYLDFTFWADWEVQVLVFGRLDMDSFPYPMENVFKFSDGDKSTQYIDSEEVKELMIQRIPPFMHRAMRLALVMDNVQVDGERVSKVPSPYEPDKADYSESKLTPVLVQVTPYNQRDINKLC